MRVFITRRIPEAGPEALRAAGHEVMVWPEDRPMTAGELLEASARAEGLVTMLNDRIDAGFLEKRSNVRAIANYAVGYNNIDVGACSARGVGVSNTPGVLTNATAEIAWMLLMMAARRGAEGERVMRKKGWSGWEPLQLLGVDVVGRTLGLIGAGRIGLRVAKMATGFDMRILYHNRKANPEMEALGANLVPLERLLRESDFVSVHVPLTEGTRHLIGAAELGWMKPTAVLINTARGPVVDEGALVEALRARTLFAAGLDVYEEEPKVHPELYGLENVVLLPHIGSATIEARSRMAAMACENMVAMLAGRKPPFPVNPEVWK